MRRARILVCQFMGLSLLCQMPGWLHAQTVTGTLVGTVTDSSGGRMSGTTVTAANELTQEKHSTVTNTEGYYLLTALPVGPYRVEVEAQGFKRFLRRGIVLDVNQNARIDAKLEVGQVTQQVVVTADVPLVDTREAQLGWMVDNRRIDDLPLNGRNIYGLVTLLPGVATETLAAQPNITEGNSVSLNGSRLFQTSYLLDGNLDNNVFRNGGLQPPNPDAVQEFQLITSNYNAEYGRSAGGVINTVTKSGTNRFHGTLFEYFRNFDLDARSFFQPTVSDLKQNQYGGTLGGPVKHDKLFFFFSYQGTRTRSGEFVNTARTPTAAERAGNFSALPANQWPHDPNVSPATPFPGGIIPASRLDPVAQSLLKTIPLPNTPDGRVQASASALQDSDEYLSKGDYLLNAAHRLMVSVFLIRGNGTFPFTTATEGTNLPGYGVATVASQSNVVVNETWTIGPALINQFAFNYSATPSSSITQNHVGMAAFGSQFVPTSPASQQPNAPGMSITNGWTVSQAGVVTQEDQIFSWTNTLSWVHGPHSIKAGGTFMHLLDDFVNINASGGNITAIGGFSGNSFSDLELGRVVFGAGLPFNSNLRSNNGALFAQDDWKISRRVTLDLGLRYDVFSPYTNTRNQVSNFIPGEQSHVFPNAPLGVVFPGDPGVPDGLVTARWGNFAPRIGVAIDPFGNGRTAIRAGFGVFYSTQFGALTNNNRSQPFQPNASVTETPNLVTPFATLATPFPPLPGMTTFILPASIPWVNPDNVTPYVEQYSFTIQRQLMPNLSLDVAYVGNVSRHLVMQRDANSPVYIPGLCGKTACSTEANVNTRRPIEPGIISSIMEDETSSNANYNALQVTLNRRFTHGLTILANYAYAKTLDNDSADPQNGTGNDFVDANNLRLDYGPSSFDIRTLFNVSFLWQLPKVRALGLVGRQILSNWQVNGIGRYTAGRPFTVTSGVDTNLDGNNNDRPNLIGDPHLSSSRPKNQILAAYFNSAAFQTPATGFDGTAGRDILYGPGSATWNLSFFRTFLLHEKFRLQFRSEFYNIFNHASFSNPNAVLSNPNHGEILTAGAGRVTQFGLRLTF